MCEDWRRKNTMSHFLFSASSNSLRIFSFLIFCGTFIFYFYVPFQLEVRLPVVFIFPSYDLALMVTFSCVPSNFKFILILK